MLQQIKKHQLYFGLIAVTLIIFFILSLLFNKTESFVFLNSFHCLWLNIFFSIYTFLGDGIIFLAVIFLFIALKKKKKAATLFLGYLSSGLVAQALKRIFYFPRPKIYFESTAFQYKYFLPDISLHGSNSFPSGHTTSAFCLATILILISKKHKICIPYFIIAVLVGYSRIYLAQHFLQDVVLGAFLGVLFGLLSYHCVYQQKILKPVKKFFKNKNPRKVSLIEKQTRLSKF